MIFSGCHIDKIQSWFLITSDIGIFIFYWIILLKQYYHLDIPISIIVSVITMTLSTNPLFSLVKIIFTIRKKLYDRKNKVNVGRDPEYEESNIWTKRKNIQISTK